jgi:glutaconate CoA-transferase, subunit A
MRGAVRFREARAELEATAKGSLDKRMPANEALQRVTDGDHVAIGGTLYSRSPMALIFALLNRRPLKLTVSRPLSCYEVELLLVAGSAERIVTSWVGIGLPWGLPRVLRHYVENGLAAYEEWSHLGIGLRYKAGAMGVPFLPIFSMLGSDLATGVGLQTVTCPYTGREVGTVPALNPDVALIHVHRADKLGNAQVDGYRHMDSDMARAARTVIVSAERIVSTDEIASRPSSTMLPHFAVDIVVEAPFGAYPNECYGLYEADFRHFDDYVRGVKDQGVEGALGYVDRHVRANEDFAGFLETVGTDRLDELAAGARSLTPNG